MIKGHCRRRRGSVLFLIERSTMKKNKREKENYLDRIPKINDKKWELDDEGYVEVTVENTGFYNTIAQKFFKKPRFSFIKLDQYGSCVWQQIDGKKTIYEIGQILKSAHKGAANQLYERLASYFRILESNGYVIFLKEKEG